jgi:hypothetical protein
VKKFINIPFLCWGVVFGLFVSFSLIVGGDAVNGKVEAGRYYLGGGVERPKEVSRTIYVLSAASVSSVALTLPLALYFGLAEERFPFHITHRARLYATVAVSCVSFLLFWSALLCVWSAFTTH